MFILAILCLVLSAILTLGSVFTEESGLRFISLLFHVPTLVFFILYIIKG